MAELICPVCGQSIDPSRYGISMWPDREGTGGAWQASWVPFIEDLRSNPTHLLHAECYAEQHGLDALLAAIHRNDERTRGAEWS